ncbi:hypothetical protein ACLOJK_002586 [Asimina triloba]
MLATTSDSSKKCVFEGGLEPLLRLPETGSMAVKEKAATAIEAIITDPENTCMKRHTQIRGSEILSASVDIGNLPNHSSEIPSATRSRFCSNGPPAATAEAVTIATVPDAISSRPRLCSSVIGSGPSTPALPTPDPSFITCLPPANSTQRPVTHQVIVFTASAWIIARASPFVQISSSIRRSVQQPPRSVRSHLARPSRSSASSPPASKQHQHPADLSAPDPIAVVVTLDPAPALATVACIRNWTPSPSTSSIRNRTPSPRSDSLFSSFRRDRQRAASMPVSETHPPDLDAITTTPAAFVQICVIVSALIRCSNLGPTATVVGVGAEDDAETHPPALEQICTCIIQRWQSISPSAPFPSVLRSVRPTPPAPSPASIICVSAPSARLCFVCARPSSALGSPRSTASTQIRPSAAGVFYTIGRQHRTRTHLHQRTCICPSVARPVTTSSDQQRRRPTATVCPPLAVRPQPSFALNCRPVDSPFGEEGGAPYYGALTSVDDISSGPHISQSVDDISSRPHINQLVDDISSGLHISQLVGDISSKPYISDISSGPHISQSVDDINSGPHISQSVGDISSGRHISQ